MPLRAIRGATCISADDSVEMAEAVWELLSEMLTRNDIGREDVVSLFLTSTPDLRCAFPAAGARLHGMQDVPLICAQEINVQGALERVIRIMAHVESSHSRSEIQHVYLRGAEILRSDLPHSPGAKA